VTFGGSVTADTFTTAAEGYSVVFNGGGIITNDATFLNTGGVTLGNGATDTITFAGGLDTTAGATTAAGTINTTNTQMDIGALTLTANTTLDAGTGSSSIINTGAVTGAGYDFTLDSGDNLAAGITVASVDNVNALTIRDSGFTTFTGTVGAVIPGAITITDTTGAVTFTGEVTADTFTTAVQGYSIAFNGGVTIADGYTKFLNTGGITFGDSTTDTITFDELTVTQGITTLNGNVVVNNLTVSSGATLNLGSNTLTVSGDFYIYGIFTAGLGTVVIDDATQVTNIYGTTFTDFTCITPGKIINVQAGSTETITGVLTLTGAKGNPIILRSTIDGIQWKLDPQGTWNVSYVDVKDSVNLNSADINPIGIIDSGNTVRWAPIVVPEAEDPETPEEGESEEPVEIDLGDDSEEETAVEAEEESVETEEISEEIFEEVEEEAKEVAEEVEEMNLLEDDSDDSDAGENFDNWAQGDNYEKRFYEKDVYRTTVICFEGRVLVAEYDESGVNYESQNVIDLTDGQKTVVEFDLSLGR